MSAAAAAVRVVPLVSRALLRALRAAHLLAAGLALLACGTGPSGCLLAGAIAIHLCIVESERRALATQLAAALFDSGGSWQLRWHDGTHEIVRLLPGALVSPWLTALSFHSGRGRVTLLVCPDTLDDASYRRLRMRLLWQGGTSPQRT